MTTTPHQKFMLRCLELAALGEGKVAPNPLVGAVLVHGERIIGEGCHEYFGGPHAEVNCLASVRPEATHLVKASTLYVSLEPCAHFGKTPPCTELIIKHKIPRVVIGCRDPFHEVNGRGIEKLTGAGVEVVSGVLEDACAAMNRHFFCFHQHHRPYIMLKWAQTADGFMAPAEPVAGERLMVSNDYSNRLVHKWRSSFMAIMVGRRTAMLDNPELNVRLWPGENPVRMVVDPLLSLPSQLKIFNGDTPAIVFNFLQHSMHELKTDWKKNDVHYYQVGRDADMAVQVVNGLYQMGIQSILVEGGARLLQSFIDAGLWDETRVITNNHLKIGRGLQSPLPEGQVLSNHLQCCNDTIRFFRKKQ